MSTHPYGGTCDFASRQKPQTEPNQAKPSQTERQTEANRDLYLDIWRQTPNVKPSQTERQTEANRYLHLDISRCRPDFYYNTI